MPATTHKFDRLYSPLGVGLVLAMAATRLMTALMYGLRPDYAPVVETVSAVLLIIALMACLIPAPRVAHRSGGRAAP